MTLMITILILEFNQNMKYSSLKNLIFPNRTSVIHVFVSSLKNPDFVCTYMHCNVCVEADKRFSAYSRADRVPPTSCLRGTSAPWLPLMSTLEHLPHYTPLNSAQ